MPDTQLTLPLSLSGMQIIPESAEFALLGFDNALDELQQKLYYMTLAYVDKNDDPEASPEYKIDIRRIAEFTDTNPATLKRNMTTAVKAMDDMKLKLQPVFQDGNKLAFTSGIYQTIIIDLDDPYTIAVRFNYDFRKQIIKMKREYDIEFPTQTIMQLNGKFTIPLYTYLLAEASLIRDKRTVVDNDDTYAIQISKDALFQRLNFTSPVGIFNKRTLPIAIEEINEHSEIKIFNVETLRKGRAITGYVFHISVSTSQKKPLFSRRLITCDEDMVPSLEYLCGRLEKMGFAESHIKHFKAELSPDRLRIWGNMLYTWYQVGDRQPAYFRAAYDGDYFGNKCGEITKMFRLVMLERSDVADEYMKNIDAEYTKRGIPQNPHFVEDLIKMLAKSKK